MNNIVFLRQVVNQIKKLDSNGLPMPANIECRSFNTNNKSGGTYYSYTGIKLLVGKKLQGREFKAHEHFFREYRERKNPNHWQNATLNFETTSGRIVKIKLRYIIKFNGLEVAY